jgi:hypothetical protein
LQVKARKPAWEVGAKAALNLKRPAAPAQPAAAAAVWKLGGDEQDEELVDEDELLTEEDKAARPAAVAATGTLCACGGQL